MNERDLQIEKVKSEIVNKVKAIEAAKLDFKSLKKGWSEKIKNLEKDKARFLEDLEALYREDLADEATELLEANPEE